MIKLDGGELETGPLWFLWVCAVFGIIGVVGYVRSLIVWFPYKRREPKGGE
jgi:hypothetical protein